MNYHYIVQCRLVWDDEDSLVHVEADDDQSAFRLAEEGARADDPDNDNEFIVQGHAKFATPPLEVSQNW